MTIEYQSAEEMLASYAERRARLYGPEPVVRATVVVPPPRPAPPLIDLPRSMPAWKRVLLETAAKHGVTEDDILGVGRTRDVVVARQEAMYRMFKHEGMPIEAIARRMDKNHATIRHGIDRYRRAHPRDLLNVATMTIEPEAPKDEPWRAILVSIANKRGLNVAQIVGDQKNREIVLAREELFDALYRRLGMSYAAIGRAIGGRCHKTVMIAIRRHEQRLGQRAEAA